MSRRQPDPGQASFDFESLLQLAAADADMAPEWRGAPLMFTTSFWPAAELDEAFQQWQLVHGQFASVPRSHMWHRPLGAERTVGLGAHSAAVFTADLRCQPGQHPPGGCVCPGGLMVRIGCDPCGWQAIGSSENVVVEQWHDHALPDWRRLPVMPAPSAATDRSASGGRAERWIEQQYPPWAQVPGAPIITTRSGSGLRHVPGGAPSGGWDLAAPPGRDRVAETLAVLRRSTLRPLGLRDRPVDGPPRQGLGR